MIKANIGQRSVVRDIGIYCAIHRSVSCFDTYCYTVRHIIPTSDSTGRPRFKSVGWLIQRRRVDFKGVLPVKR